MKTEFTPQEVFEWFKSKKYQREQGDQEYTMIYEIDLPKIINEFLKDKMGLLSVCDLDKLAIERADYNVDTVFEDDKTVFVAGFKDAYSILTKV